jgi:hypothetical protein
VDGRKLAGVSKINLHNCITDPSWMNEVLAFRLHRDAGVPAPRTAYARVFVTVPGKYEREYLGLYSLVENVDRNFVEENFGTRAGGLLKPVSPQLFADLGEDWSKYRQTYDPKTRLSEDEIRRVMALCRLVDGADDAEFAAKLGDHLDLGEFARYLAVMVWLADLDGMLGPGQNFYLYLKPGSQRLLFMPWDQDHSWGQFGMRGTQEDREGLSVHRPWQGENRFLERVFKVEEFKKLYLTRLEEFSKTIFAPERFHRQVDEIAAAIRPAVEEESTDKLERFATAVSGEGAGPDDFLGGFGFRQPVKPIKPFVKVRAQSVADQLSGKTEGRKLGEFGFGGPGARGGGGRPGRGGFGPGNFLAGAFTAALDGDKDGAIARQEFTEGFGKWFEGWNSDQSGALTEEQLRAGIDRDLSPARGGPPGGPRFGPPDGPPRER